MHIVIFQKNNSITKFQFTGKMKQLFDEILALIVFGVGLAGEDKLNRMFLRVYDRFQAPGVLKEQIGAFIGCKPSGKSNGQHIGVQYRFKGLNHIARCIAACILFNQLLPAGPHQAGAVQFMAAPQLLVVNIVDVLDIFGFTGAHIPIRPQIAPK